MPRTLFTSFPIPRCWIIQPTFSLPLVALSSSYHFSATVGHCKRAEFCWHPTASFLSLSSSFRSAIKIKKCYFSFSIPDLWHCHECCVQTTGRWWCEDGTEAKHHQLLHKQGLQEPCEPDLGPGHVLHGVLRCQQLHWLPPGQQVCGCGKRRGSGTEDPWSMLHSARGQILTHSNWWDMYWVSLSYQLVHV